jgi:3-oxoadipate enol-lactonase
MLGRTDLRGELEKIRCPTTVIVGEEDYAAPPSMARALHQGIAGSRLVVLAGARHLTPIEVPERISVELEQLLVRQVAA